MQALRHRGIGIELVQALVVLAVAFLAFVQHPAAEAATHDTGMAFCGQPPAGEDGDRPQPHRSCDACRLSEGLLCPGAPPTLALPSGASLAIAYALPAPPAAGDAFPPSAPPRGPPA